jgi:hypothetical protein
MTTSTTAIGIECSLGWFDSPDTIEYAIVLFGDAPDTDDQDDDAVFYYLDETEVAHLHKCIAESRDKCAWGKEWYIDLTDGYDFFTEVPA